MSAATEGRKRIARGFVVNDAMIDDFKQFLNEEKVKIDAEAFQKDLEFIKGRSTSRSTSRCSASAKAQKNLISRDPQAQFALAQFGEAVKLTELAKTRTASKGGH